ncbi:hypothetical protein VP01_1974g6, partial [Puccinia sorghi]
GSSWSWLKKRRVAGGKPGMTPHPAIYILRQEHPLTRTPEPSSSPRTGLNMGDLPMKHKCKLILREMRRHLDVHCVLMDCWCEGVDCMWDYCQPRGKDD